METVNKLIGQLNGLLFSDYVVYTLLGTGVLFTLWSFFGQFRAMTHGVQVVRGVYDSKDDPGAINHFQALSAALSATVGLGNIAGVGLAVALGGPGAVFWMWIIGLVGMALKMTEVTQSMLYRNTDDPENPHGGPMFVAREGFKRMGLAPLGVVVGGIFVVTLLISAVTGGNMFQAWSVADITNTYFNVPEQATGIILAIVVGLVIIGGIKRIGNVASRIVPVMCALYVIAAIYVLALNAGAIPGVLRMIVEYGLGLGEAEPENAFLGATIGVAMSWGIKRALFSSEAGQGSAPIAHAAAKTDEPVREGVVAGLEPFIDTIVVCTITALVILTTGTWNRSAEAIGTEIPTMVAANAVVYLDEDEEKQEVVGLVVETTDTSIRMFVNDSPPFVSIARDRIVLEETKKLEDDTEASMDEDAAARLDNVTAERPWAKLAGRWLPSFVPEGESSADVGYPSPAITPRTDEAEETARSDWSVGNDLFFVVRKRVPDPSSETGFKIELDRVLGEIRKDSNDVLRATFSPVATKSASSPPPAPQLTSLDGGDQGLGYYGHYKGASLTAHAFDRVTPGLGMVLVTIAAWLFAVSTMISWSYYGEQGISYLGGGTRAIFVYKVIYCALIVVSCLGFIKTEEQLDMWTSLGLGVMLVANIPIMLIFGAQAMSAYHEYLGKLKRGEFPRHDAPKVTDVVEGRDVE